MVFLFKEIKLTKFKKLRKFFKRVKGVSQNHPEVTIRTCGAKQDKQDSGSY